ncbi:UNVERIFIED_CONTAM: hypothetical protein HDU68_007487 [Siphonaria sp. JEL0065]|nr:hypothetical protein HDU68_007487 [Siphonaria sp. JEL0065]
MESCYEREIQVLTTRFENEQQEKKAQFEAHRTRSEADRARSESRIVTLEKALDAERKRSRDLECELRRVNNKLATQKRRITAGRRTSNNHPVCQQDYQSQQLEQQQQLQRQQQRQERQQEDEGNEDDEEEDQSRPDIHLGSAFSRTFHSSPPPDAVPRTGATNSIQPPTSMVGPSHPTLGGCPYPQLPLELDADNRTKAIAVNGLGGPIVQGFGCGFPVPNTSFLFSQASPNLYANNKTNPGGIDGLNLAPRIESNNLVPQDQGLKDPTPAPQFQSLSGFPHQTTALGVGIERIQSSSSVKVSLQKCSTHPPNPAPRISLPRSRSVEQFSTDPSAFDLVSILPKSNFGFQVQEIQMDPIHSPLSELEEGATTELIRTSMVHRFFVEHIMEWESRQTQEHPPSRDDLRDMFKGYHRECILRASLRKTKPSAESPSSHEFESRAHWFLTCHQTENLKPTAFAFEHPMGPRFCRFSKPRLDEELEMRSWLIEIEFFASVGGGTVGSGTTTDPIYTLNEPRKKYYLKVSGVRSTDGEASVQATIWALYSFLTVVFEEQRKLDVECGKMQSVRALGGPEEWKTETEEYKAALKDSDQDFLLGVNHPSLGLFGNVTLHGVSETVCSVHITFAKVTNLNLLDLKSDSLELYNEMSNDKSDVFYIAVGFTELGTSLGRYATVQVRGATQTVVFSVFRNVVHAYRLYAYLLDAFYKQKELDEDLNLLDTFIVSKLACPVVSEAENLSQTPELLRPTPWRPTVSEKMGGALRPASDGGIDTEVVGEDIAVGREKKMVANDGEESDMSNEGAGHDHAANNEERVGGDHYNYENGPVDVGEDSSSPSNSAASSIESEDGNLFISLTGKRCRSRSDSAGLKNMKKVCIESHERSPVRVRSCDSTSFDSSLQKTVSVPITPAITRMGQTSADSNQSFQDPIWVEASTESTCDGEAGVEFNEGPCSGEGEVHEEINEGLWFGESIEPTCEGQASNDQSPKELGEELKELRSTEDDPQVEKNDEQEIEAAFGPEIMRAPDDLLSESEDVEHTTQTPPKVGKKKLAPLEKFKGQSLPLSTHELSANKSNSEDACEPATPSKKLSKTKSSVHGRSKRQASATFLGPLRHDPQDNARVWDEVAKDTPKVITLHPVDNQENFDPAL